MISISVLMRVASGQSRYSLNCIALWSLLSEAIACLRSPNYENKENPGLEDFVAEHEKSNSKVSDTLGEMNKHLQEIAWT